MSRFRAHCRVLLITVLIAACLARIDRTRVDRDDRSLILISNPFGFLDGGQLEYKLKHAEIAHGNDWKLEDFGFFLTASPNEVQEQYQIDRSFCFLRSSIGKPVLLFTFAQDAAAAVVKGDAHAFSNATEIPAAGEYSLYFNNCAQDTAVSFALRAEMYNINQRGVKNYLSAGEAALPVLYVVMGVLFTLAAAAWAYMVWRDRVHAQHIHTLMLVLVSLKTLTLFCLAAEYHYISLSGHPKGWNVAFYVFTFLRSIMFFSLIVLVGTGWSYMKPYLHANEKQLLMVVIPLQVFANIAIIVIDENSPAGKQWLTWRDIFNLIDIICCCAVLVPIVWSIKHHREAASTDGKAARSLSKLKLFREFYVLVVLYIYVTRIVVFLLRTTAPFQYEWVSGLVNELATLVFYVLTGLKFRPHSENPYFKMEDDEADADVEITHLTDASPH